MARITYVKQAQQRYKTVPVIDPETGKQKVTPVMKTVRVRNDDGTITTSQVPKTTKSGRAVTMRVTVADKSQPLPNRTCDKCRTEITVGSPYKHISPKSGPYGGRTMYRCGSCPGWRVWEYSNSLSARIAEIEHNATDAANDATDAEGVRDALRAAAESIRELAEEKRESAQSIEDGFGHSTSMSEELADQADQLESWADDVEASADDDPAVGSCDDCAEGRVECDTCSGTGETQITDSDDCEECSTCNGETAVDCDTCDGTGENPDGDPDEDTLEEWRSEALSVLGNCPV